MATQRRKSSPGEAVEPLNTQVLIRRSLEFSSTGFITIISIIQGVALGTPGQRHTVEALRTLMRPTVRADVGLPVGTLLVGLSSGRMRGKAVVETLKDRCPR
jgi:hypothetical protein